MGYLSLYRKYRSQTFSDLIGQDHVVRTLQNGIASGRIAHAYLFTGPRGTGKTSSARLLAKALCCVNGPTAEPDNTCEICRSITEGTCVDVLEMDAASEAGVENVRDTIVDVVEYQPMVARYKVFIIDEVHDLSGKAFDALLKTIEEPPPHVIFILATTEYNKVPPTIRSRCQKHEFHRASLPDLVKRLSFVAKEEGVDIEPAAITAIARMADGGYRDGLTLLEQAMITSEGKITLQHVYDQLGLVSEEAVDGLLMAMKDGQVPTLMEILGDVARMGRDPRSVLESMLYRLADLTRAAYGVEIGGSHEATHEATLHETATRLGREKVLAFRSELAEAHKVIRDISLPRLWLEAELIRIATQSDTKPQQAQPVKAAVVARPAPPQAEPPALKVTEGRPPAQSKEIEPAAPPSADPALDGARELWGRVMAELPGNAPIGLKLHGSTVAAVHDHSLTIEVERQVFCDWIMENPKRQGHIVSILHKLTGQDWKVSYCVARKPDLPQEPEAVELPAEGQKLAQMAREILGGH